MEKVLIAVDETRGSKAVLPAFRNLIRRPRTVVLVTVQRLEGDSLMLDMLGEAELSTLRRSMKGSERKETLDRRSAHVLAFYANELRNEGIDVKTMVRDGPPAEEILKVAQQEGVDLIITGHSCKTFLQRLMKGSVSRDIRKNGRVPLLVAKDAVCEEQMPGRGSRERVQRPGWRPAVMAVRIR